MLKLLHATVLSVTFVGYVVASDLFKKVVFKFEFDVTKLGLGYDILQHRSYDFHPRATWIDGITKPEVLCSPETFLDRLNKLRPKIQESAVKMGIYNLFLNKRTDCIHPLLAALESRGLLGKRLKDVAIQEAFDLGARKHSEYWVKALYDNPAITSKVYASGLVGSGRLDAQDPVFKWLLETASCKDLQAVRDNGDHLCGFEDFRVAFNEALSVAKPEKARVGVIGPRAKAVKKIVSEVVSTSEQGFVEIICAYVAEEISEYDRE